MKKLKSVDTIDRIITCIMFAIIIITLTVLTNPSSERTQPGNQRFPNPSSDHTCI